MRNHIKGSQHQGSLEPLLQNNVAPLTSISKPSETCEDWLRPSKGTVLKNVLCCSYKSPETFLGNMRSKLCDYLGSGTRTGQVEAGGLRFKKSS